MFLTGVYDDRWNAGFTSVDAASFVSISTAVAYTTPFMGAILADKYLGDYRSIIIGTTCLYLPGLFLVALTTIPGLLGETFNTMALSIAVLVLWPMGTGIVKSVVNVFGARQFHPILQSSLIESYYVNFYASINIGALTGASILPILAQRHLTIAYSVPFFMLLTGMILFLTGTPRYVIGKPKNDLFAKKWQPSSPSPSTDNIPLTTTLRISLLIVPFCIAYNQMPTTFIVQGTVMSKAFGFIDAATTNCLDTISVLVFGYIAGQYLYPALNVRNVKIPTTYKFAIGSGLGVLSMLWSLYVEYLIHSTYARDQRPINILWQAPSYILIGMGEIFAVSSAYEVAFTASAPQSKVLASAINIFCIGGIPNAICIILYQTCSGWFRNHRGTTSIQKIEDYTTAHVGNYFWVLVGILILGVILNLLPCIREFVDSVERQASDLVRTPLLRRVDTEETPLIRKRVFGKSPVLYRMASIRAGPSAQPRPARKPVKVQHVQKLYHAFDQNKQPPTSSSSKNAPTLLPPQRQRQQVLLKPISSATKGKSGGSLPVVIRHAESR
jgi:POT family proton-dependent oligopeptide transporter